MKLEVFHQLGFRYNWNLDCIRQDEVGDGVIFGPRYMPRNTLESLDIEIRRISFYDPQFFLPDTTKGGLETYEFFPDLVSDGFETHAYSDNFAYESAKRCVAFQLHNGFKYIVIPTRYSAGMPTNFCESQQELFVDPFLNAISNLDTNKKIFVQLILNDNMLKDEEYSTNLLNWITGFTSIDGVYLIVETSSRSKQNKDLDFLLNYMVFVDKLRQNEFEVALGYLNTEALLLSITDPSIVTLGSYENLRKFNIKAYQDTENQAQQGPNPRLYMSKLLQWVDYRYIGAIQRVIPNSDEFFDKNSYQALMFKPSYKWHFTKPELYKHYFVEFSKQLNQVGHLEEKDRFNAVCDMLQHAMNNHSYLNDRGIYFDQDSDGSHLPVWLTSANQFAIYKGWRR